MKVLLSIAIVTAVFQISAATAQTPCAAHLGLWTDVDRHDTSTIQFRADGRLLLQLGLRVIGSDEDSLRITYVVDCSTDPIRIDIIAMDTSGLELKRAASIMRFLGPDQMELGASMNDPSEPPKSFDDPSIDVVRFTRALSSDAGE